MFEEERGELDQVAQGGRREFHITPGIPVRFELMFDQGTLVFSYYGVLTARPTWDLS